MVILTLQKTKRPQAVVAFPIESPLKAAPSPVMVCLWRAMLGGSWDQYEESQFPEIDRFSICIVADFSSVLPFTRDVTPQKSHYPELKSSTFPLKKSGIPVFDGGIIETNLGKSPDSSA